MLAALELPLRNPSPVMKEAAARALGAVLEADYLGQQGLRDGALDCTHRGPQRRGG